VFLTAAAKGRINIREKPEHAPESLLFTSTLPRTLLVTIVPLLGAGAMRRTGANGQFRHSLVHHCVQRLDDVEIDFVVVIPNTCFPPRDWARERAHIVCGWPREPGDASDGEDLGYECGMENDVS
jgi:hypothetical protein